MTVLFSLLIPKMSTFTLAISPVDHFQFALIHQPNSPGSCAVLLFTASDFASITSHIHNSVLFFLWLRLFVLSGVISPLISSSILGTIRPGEFVFVSYLFAFSYCSWGSQGIVVKWFAIPFSRGPCFVRTLHHDPSVLGWPYTAWLIVLLS